MKKNIKNLLISGAIGLSVALVGIGALTLPDRTVSAEGLFQEPQGVSITQNYQISGEETISDTRSGVLLSSSVSGTSVDFADKMSGLFELDFRVFSQSTFVASGYPYGYTLNNPALELNEFSIRITNAANEDESFAIVLDGKSIMNYATPQARVEVEGKQVGLFYWKGRNNSGNTTGANTAGRFTALWNTSFSNKAYDEDTIDYIFSETESENLQSNVIGFDPFAMEIYAKYATGEKRVIWNLSNAYNDGQSAATYMPFESYNVSLEFTDVAKTKTAKVLLYSLNGQSLAGETLTNNCGPNVYMSASYNAVVGEKYILDNSVVTYDVCGDETKNVAIAASVDGLAQTVYDKFGKPTTSYSEGCYIIPNVAGVMSIALTASDSAYAGQTITEKVSVYELKPTAEYALDWRLESGEYGVGSVISVPAATVSCDSLRKDGEVFVSVYKNGTPLSGYEKIKAPFDFTMDEIATYAVEYSCTGSDSKTVYEWNVCDDKPAFNLNFQIAETLRCGEVLNVPTASTLFKGESAMAAVKVIYPNGNVFNGSQIELNIAGEYTVEYTVKYFNEIYKKEYKVTCLDSVGAFTGSGFTVEYGAPNNRYAQQTGVYASASSSTNKLTYTKKLDISKSTKNDTLVRLYSADNWGGDPDGSHAAGVGTVPDIIITDAHDPNNFVTVRAKWGWSLYHNCTYAFAPGQTVKGLMNDGSVAAYPTWTKSLFYGGYDYVYEGMAFDEQSYNVQYDAAEKAIYVNNNMIIDLDAGYQESIWKGFTTGEVYISFTNVHKIMITEIYGNTLTEKYLLDTTAPVLIPETQGDELPNAVIGKPFKVFDAYVYDNLTENVRLSTRVFYNYGSADYTEVNVKNGVFTPKKAGRYTIEYTAVDAFYNVTVKTVTVEAVEESEITPVSFALSDEPSAVGVVGIKYDLPEIINAAGGTGALVKGIEILDADGESVTVNKNYFVPVKAGKHTVNFFVKDYVGVGEVNSAVETYEIEVTIDDAPIMGDLRLPEVILSGMNLQLPVIDAVDWKADPTGATHVTPSISAVIGEQSFVVDENNVVTPTVTAGTRETMTVTYTAQGAHGVATKTADVVVVNPKKENGFMAEYFYKMSGSVEKTAVATGINFKVTSASDDNKVRFINPVLANGFAIKFTLGDNAESVQNDTDKIIVRLYDSQNMDISVRFEFIKNLEETDVTSTSYFSINGGESSAISGNFYSASMPLGISSFSQETLVCYDLNGNGLGSIAQTESGEVFKGFPSGKVWVELEFGNVQEGGVDVTFNSLNNQSFSAENFDVVIPQLALTQGITASVEIGKPFVLPSIVAQDVLSATSTATITVVKVGGEYSQTFENIDTELTLDEVGTYRISYMVKDAAGRRFTQTYMFSVVEYEPPVVTFSAQLPKSVKVGTTVTLPTVTVVDNASENSTVNVFLVKPNCSMYVWTEQSFTAEEVGTYKVRYFIYDDSFNYVMEEFIIEVTK